MFTILPMFFLTYPHKIIIITITNIIIIIIITIFVILLLLYCYFFFLWYIDLFGQKGAVMVGF